MLAIFPVSMTALMTFIWSKVAGIEYVSRGINKLTIRDRNLFAHGQDTVLGSCRVTENQIFWKQVLGLGGPGYVY